MQAEIMLTLYLEIDPDKWTVRFAGQAFQSLVLYLWRERDGKGKRKTPKNKTPHHFICLERRYLIKTKPSRDRSRFTGLELREQGGGCASLRCTESVSFWAHMFCGSGVRESLSIWQFAQHTADVMKFTLGWKNSPCHTLSFWRKWISLIRALLYFPHEFW